MNFLIKINQIKIWHVVCLQFHSKSKNFSRDKK